MDKTDRMAFALTWHASHEEAPMAIDPLWAISETERWWRDWTSRCAYRGPYRDAVRRSLITLKAMTYAPTGAIVASPTTSLPELIGGERNWDYRFTWLRDGSFTLYALSVLGFTEEAHAFTHWLQRLSFSDGEDLQIMYGIRGSANWWSGCSNTCQATKTRVRCVLAMGR